MAEAAETKITEELKSEVIRVDKECIRPLQVEAFRCSAKCCEDRKNPQEVVQRCLTSCMQPVMDAESRLQGEVQHLQDRLTRCAQQCEDEYKDSIPSHNQPLPSSDAMEYAKSCAEKCLVNCCKTNSHLIPKLIAKYRSSLRNCS